MVLWLWDHEKLLGILNKARSALATRDLQQQRAEAAAQKKKLWKSSYTTNCFCFRGTENIFVFFSLTRQTGNYSRLSSIPQTKHARSIRPKNFGTILFFTVVLLLYSTHTRDTFCVVFEASRELGFRAMVESIFRQTLWYVCMPTNYVWAVWVEHARHSQPAFGRHREILN